MAKSLTELFYTLILVQGRVHLGQVASLSQGKSVDVIQQIIYHLQFYSFI